jgi:SAM-dependent methyltransferase
MYADDLAYVHDAGFSDHARRMAPEVARLLRQRFGGVRGHTPPLVVEFGCGGGRLAADLVERGYRVFGVDQSAAMIRIARRAAPRARFTVGTLSRTAIPRCAAVVVVGEVVNYLGASATAAAHDAQLRRFFAHAARALTPGGFLLFDFMTSARGRTFAAKRRAGRDWGIVARADVNADILTRRMTTVRRVGGSLRSADETHRVRLLSRQEITTALDRAGFTATLRSSIGRVRMIPGDLIATADVK